jgi:hypothetical protein
MHYTEARFADAGDADLIHGLVTLNALLISCSITTEEPTFVTYLPSIRRQRFNTVRPLETPLPA